MAEMDFDNIEEVAEYLKENRDEICVSPEKTVAMLWDDVSEGIIVVRGDFRGGEDQINEELRRILSAQNN